MNIHKFPFVSILIAARNEQDNIIDCLSALEHLTWPKEKFEVLIGNDHSEDNTKTLVEDYIKDKSNFHLHDINNNSPPLPPSPSETEKRRNGETEKGGIGETEKRGRQVTDSSIHRFTDSGGGR
ncbi:MAG: glycosyltransferase, partial [Cytophagales bacterium]|nr:glycosyltransferase [Cytophagales bacterium]